MAKLAAQLKNKFFGLFGRITSCGRAHKDAGKHPDPFFLKWRVCPLCKSFLELIYAAVSVSRHVSVAGATEPKSVASQVHSYSNLFLEMLPD
jgi:hypothetical protein